MATPVGSAPRDGSDSQPTPAQNNPHPAAQTSTTALHTSGQPAYNPLNKDVERGPIDSCVECRICLESTQPEDMVAPCACTGTVKYAHLRCLKRWCAERQSLSCELCAAPYTASVAPKLEPVVREAQRTAADAMLAAALNRTQGEPSDGALRMTWSRFWCQAILLVGLLVGVLYLALFVDVQQGGSPWTVLLWKVFTILLPLYLVGFWMRKTLIDSGFCGVMSARLRTMRQPRPSPAAEPAATRLPL